MKSTLMIALLLSTGLAFAQMPTPPADPSAMPKTVNDAKTLVKKADEQATVHINSASVDDLAKLPGIGPVKAKSIVAARPFKSVEELKNVKGIKEGVYNKIKGMIAL